MVQSVQKWADQTFSANKGTKWANSFSTYGHVSKVGGKLQYANISKNKQQTNLNIPGGRNMQKMLHTNRSATHM